MIMTKQRKALFAALELLEDLQGGCTDHNDGTVEAITVWTPEIIEQIKEALKDAENLFPKDSVILPTGKTPTDTQIQKGMMALLRCSASELEVYSPLLYEQYEDDVKRVYNAMIEATK